MAPQSELIHVDSSGSGRPIVMLHGWGMHGGMFKPLVDAFTRKHSVATVDLPGHGFSAGFDHVADPTRHADYLVTQLSALFEQGVTLVGWSLGGLLAQSIAAQYPQYVRRLVLVCSTPSFVEREDWKYAIDNAVLRLFAENLLRDYEGTLSRFLALQFLGSQDQKTQLRRARDLVFSRRQPQPAMLQQGLQLLEQADLRTQLDKITCPTLIINSERDTLVPPAAAQYLAEHLPNGRSVIIKGAGHAPFLSHTATVTQFMERFIHED